MSMGRWGGERQREFWVAADEVADVPRHVFYDRLNELLAEAGFDRFVEQLCLPFYKDGGRPGIPPGRYFRMLLVGYFEGIGSQRGIAWRCADSLSLKRFLDVEPHERTPDHSSLTVIRDRLSLEVFLEVFAFVLGMADVKKLLKAQNVGVDATFLEANAAMRSIVRKDTGEDYEAFVRSIMVDQGEAERPDDPSDEEVRRFDRKRKGKTCSNREWESATDHDARIVKMKDGRTRLGYKAEHVVDLDGDFILSACVYHGDEGDTATIERSLDRAEANLPWADPYAGEASYEEDSEEWSDEPYEESCEAGAERSIANVAADKGYHGTEVLTRLRESGVRTYVAEPDRGRRRWTDKPTEWKETVYANRRRVKGDHGRRLQRLRSERVERSFAHVCDTGGSRRSWLRGLEKANKRYLMAAMAHNLGVLMRHLFGTGKPRELAGRMAAVFALHTLVWAARAAFQAVLTALGRSPAENRPESPDRRHGGARRPVAVTVA